MFANLLGGCSFSVPGVPLSSSIISSSVPESFYSVLLLLSMDPPVVPRSAYGTLQILSVVPLFVSIFEYGALRSGV